MLRDGSVSEPLRTEKSCFSVGVFSQSSLVRTAIFINRTHGVHPCVGVQPPHLFPAFALLRMSCAVGFNPNSARRYKRGKGEAFPRACVFVGEESISGRNVEAES